MTNDISQLKGLKIKAYVTDRYAEDRDEHIMVMNRKSAAITSLAENAKHN